MQHIIKDILAIIAMLIIAGILIACIANDLDHGIVYTGLCLISGLGGYSVGRIITKRQHIKPPK